MKKKYLTYIIIVAVIIIAIVVFTQIKKKKNMPEWRTETPSIGTIREVVTATGSLNPTMLVEVGTEVSGKIEKLYKDFNDTVKKGDLLAKLDTDILTANLESARADVNKATIVRDDAKMEYETSKTLYEKGMGSQYEMEKNLYAYQQAEQNLANAILKLKTAQKNLQNASITSPINGVVVSREVSEGQTVAAAMSSPTLFKIANNLDLMQITAVVDEADIGKVKVGMPVEFTVDAYPEDNAKRAIKEIERFAKNIGCEMISAKTKISKSKETVALLTFNVSEMQKNVIEKALKKVTGPEKVKRSRALELIAADFLSGQPLQNVTKTSNNTKR